MKVVTQTQMRELDRAAMAKGVASLALMENAARGVLASLRQVGGSVAGRSIAIVAGPGNNGGDGLALARLLLGEGALVVTVLISPPDKLSGDAKIQYERLKKIGGTIHIAQNVELDRVLSDAWVIVDAIFGTGFRREIGGPARDVIRVLNTIGHRPGRSVVSIDVPSGVLADTGRPLGEAVRASLTATLGLPKVGLLVPPGTEYTGILKIVDIGIPPDLVARVETPFFLTEPDDFRALFSERPLESHKGNFGHTVFIASSRNMPGAGLLAGKAALRSGAGRVTLIVPQSARRTIKDGFLELMVTAVCSDRSGGFSTKASSHLRKLLQGIDSVGVGPGIGRGRGSRSVVRWLVDRWEGPLVIDADGLNVLGTSLRLMKRRRRPNRILSPHPGEAARLLGTSSAKVQGDRIGAAKALVLMSGAHVILKGYRTLTASPDGTFYFNPTGNPGMATAGSGDVLTGIVSALTARGEACKTAAIGAVYLHGRGGDLAVRETGEDGLIASDIIEKIPQAVSEL